VFEPQPLHIHPTFNPALTPLVSALYHLSHMQHLLTSVLQLGSYSLGWPAYENGKPCRGLHTPMLTCYDRLGVGCALDSHAGRSRGELMHGDLGECRRCRGASRLVHRRCRACRHYKYHDDGSDSSFCVYQDIIHTGIQFHDCGSSMIVFETLHSRT
jgi:hypothetical protein